MSLSQLFADIESGNFSHAVKRVEDYFTDEEKVALAFLTPLADQIVTAGAALGKATVDAGVQVIIDTAKASVVAGAAALSAGQDPVKAAEVAFLSTGASEGITAISNAEAGAIKAAVSIAQSAAAALSSPNVASPATAS